MSELSASDGHHSWGRSAGSLRASPVPPEELRHVLHLQGLLQESHDDRLHSGERQNQFYCQRPLKVKRCWVVLSFYYSCLPKFDIDVQCLSIPVTFLTSWIEVILWSSIRFKLDGTVRDICYNFFLPAYTAAPGFEPTSVIRVAPDWEFWWRLYRLSYSAVAMFKLVEYFGHWSETSLQKNRACSKHLWKWG